MEKRKIVKTKIMIGVPYKKGTTEFENLMGSLGEMNRDNFFEYTIKVCNKCDNCGATNDTVKSVDVPMSYKKNEHGNIVVKETQKLMLCDYCVRDFE